ncbi:DUF2845 domain-containing protein [Methylophaga sp.]|uniref:DUF2845 domain-containing protein n=1 Tax=Methylophaga sp. TaxID=2024840 RepID=UPI003F69E5D3
MIKTVNTIALVAGFALTSTGWAGSSDMETLKCGAKAIELGMSADDIKATCGQNWEPAYISKHVRPALGADETAKVQEDHFEKWMYRVSGSSDTHVILKNDEVIRIFTMVQQ